MRKRDVKCALLLAAAVSVSASRSFGSAFNSINDLVVLQTNGDGNTYSNGGVNYGGDSVTLLDMIVSAGTGILPSVSVANSLNLPTNTLSYNGSSGLGLVIPDTGSHPGQITLSQDGHSLELGTYLAPVGPVNYYGTETAPDNATPNIAPRVITVIGSSGSVTPAATLSGASDYSSVDIRQVTSLNGSQFWSLGNGAKPSSEEDIGGFRFSTVGATSTTSLNIQDDVDARTSTIYDGQLYIAGGSVNNPTALHTFSRFGTGLSTTPQNWAPLPSVVPPSTSTVPILGDQSPCFITLNDGATVLYESDSTTGDIEKWSLIDGLWNLEGKIAFGKDNIENIAAKLNSNGSVSLFADNNEASYGAGNIYGYVDTGGSGQMNLSGQSPTASSGTPVYTPGAPIYTGATTGGSEPVTQKFWGLSFAPSSSAAVANQIWGNLNGSTGAAGGSWGNTANWSAGAIPDASGSTATFGPGLTSNSSGGLITLDGTQTVGHLVFNDAAVSYTLSSGTGGTLDIDNTDPNSSGVPSIYNKAGSQTITAAIQLASGVTVADQYQSSMLISSSISGAGGMQVYGPGSLTLSGSSNYSGATVVHSGAVVVTATGSFPTTTSLTVGDTADTAAVGLTASVTFNASAGTGIRPVTLNSLNIVSNGTVDLLHPTATVNRSVLILDSLTFAGTSGAWAGQLDLSSNDMIVHNGNLATVTNQVAQGYRGGQWNGAGGVTSTAAANDTTHLTALGVIQNNQSGAALYTASHQFDNMTPGAGDILVKYTYYGDTNLDGKVDGTDYSRIDAAYLADQSNPSAATGWFNGDFNYDGVINGSDYTLIDNAFNTQGSSLAAQVVNLSAQSTSQIAEIGGIAAVPEPTNLAVIALVTAGLLGRRRV